MLSSFVDLGADDRVEQGLDQRLLQQLCPRWATLLDLVGETSGIVSQRNERVRL